MRHPIATARTISSFILLPLLLALPHPQRADAQIIDQQRSKLAALVLVQEDLKNATKTMTIFDRNEDGVIDETEQAKLSWRKDMADYDVDRDGKLTHLEVALGFAQRRINAGVEQEDINNANIYLRRHDQNKNGQLDPDEITASGWPDEPQEFDQNGDGIITLSEMAERFAFMKGLRREMGIEKVDQVTAIRTVRQFDLDGDKKLDETEQKAAGLPKPGEQFDENEDGKLEIIEIATMLGKHRKETGMSKSDLARLRSLFESLDLDKDGVIVLNQFPDSAPFVTQLKEFDENKNGEVTRDEVQNLLIRQRKEKGYNDDQYAEAKRLMLRHDQNQNTWIDASELFAKPSEGQLAAETMRVADTDGDNRITLDELARYLATKSK
ncbi:hypothetical protein [Stieleria varia]|uniref:EF hand n=1 Tax=Stieleria varia TaxID=2528005 RepID=A0A5C6B5D7_9BACT|nr:hypothetical protein [Stieleria varia]TWU07505.1 EF hand [Stieleria varia]